MRSALRPGLWLASLALLLAGPGCVRRPLDEQRALARALRPAPLLAGPPAEPGPAAEPRVLGVRVWVDEEVLRQVPDYRARISEQLRRASQVLEPQFGHRLELVALVAWPRRDPSADLAAALYRLRAADPGRDVELVLGYVSAARLPARSAESLGVAEQGGRHIVLRAAGAAGAPDEPGPDLALLPLEERRALARERQLHREVTILLHEWGHTMGAIHEDAASSIMADVYHPQASGFTPAAVARIQAHLRRSAGAPALAGLPSAPGLAVGVRRQAPGSPP